MDIKTLTEEIEKISKSYSQKFKITRNANWFILKLQEELGEVTKSYLVLIGKGRRKEKSEKELQEDFSQELTDVFCHVLLLARFYKIDLEKEIEKKWFRWNKK